MGKIISIEGLDACGKETQSLLLTKRLCDMGYKTKLVSFPRYGSEGCAFVEKYLDGGFCESVRNNPKCCSAFYTIDRLMEFTENLSTFYNEKDSIIVCDRYIGSNAMYQGSKFKYDEDRLLFANEIYSIETSLGIPEEDLCLFLNCDLSIIKDHLEKKKNLDTIEKDFNFISSAKEVGDLLISKEFRNWKNVNCCDNGRMRSIEEISNDLVELCLLKMKNDRW